MTGERGGRRKAGALMLTSLLLTGCSGEDPGAPAAPGPGTLSGPTAGTPAAGGPLAPPPGLKTPDSSAGPLSKRSFPTPRQLGAGWVYAVDPGDAEEGYLGNGTPALERDPGEVVALAVPFGCKRPTAMPIPTHALEVDYTADDVMVIAIRGDFSDRATARAFFTGRAANLERCKGRSGGQAIGTLVARTRVVRDGVLLNDRTPGSDPWTELAVLDGDQVVLVAARTVVGQAPMTRAGARRLADVFQR